MSNVGTRKTGRRYSDSNVLSAIRSSIDNIDNARVPPLHNTFNDKDKNVWENKIINEEKVNHDYRTLDSEVLLVDCNDDEIEDDWFTKLAKLNEFKSNMYNLGSDSSTAIIPLLPGKEFQFKEKTMKTLRVGLKKIWKRGSITITEADPTYKVSYLGNVITGWAKGEGCVEKPLATLWKNYTSSTKPDVQMKLTITQSGLKAVTKEHGLTEYWSNRITYCSSPIGYPKVFCWVYRHEGRKLKQELRCHAVLCSKESTAQTMAMTLRLRLAQALSEFKKDKILRQNARLSLANSVYENPSLPRRKILLSTGSHVYKPPLERSKSAPKLMVIEESMEEDEVQKDDDEDIKEIILPSEANKATNLNFVKRFCTSIENLVENTSNYRRKFLHERRHSVNKDFKIEERKKPILISKSCEELDKEGEDYIKKRKHRKSVTFEDEKTDEDLFKKCIDYKKDEDVINEETSDNEEEKEESNEIKDKIENDIVPDIPTTKEVLNLVVINRDSESSDDSSNSLQSISSTCSSDISLINEKLINLENINEQDEIKIRYQYQTDRKRFLDNMLFDNNADDVFLLEEKVIFHPTGGKARSTGKNPIKKYSRSQTYPPYDKFSEEFSLECDSLSDDDEDVVSDESGYVELNENTIKRLSLDSKEKDIPYHQIIKSNDMRPRPLESSEIQV